MKTLPLSAIQISPTRQRRAFPEKELNELKESILSRGLFHAVCVRYVRTVDTMNPNEMGYFLVSGERRLRAIQDIYQLGGTFTHDQSPVPAGEVPYTDLGELDELAREEAEAEENLRRANLTWQESAIATTRIAALRARQAEAAGLPAPSVADIAREVRDIPRELADGELGDYQAQTRKEIAVAAHLHDPEVQAAKSVNDAFKVLKRKEEVKRNIELAATVGKTFTADLHVLLNEDSIPFMQHHAKESFDVILTDPPYGMGADEFGDSGGMAPTAGHHYKDTYAYWQQLMRVFAVESFRLAKPQAHLYVFCDFDRFHELKGLLDIEGWDVHRTPIIWHNPGGMRLPWVDFGPQRKWQMVLYAMKGRRPVTRIYPDLVSYSSDENLGHAGQKPMALLVDLLKRSCNAGDTVLDPFAGTAGVVEAAHQLKCRAVAVEIAAESFAVGVKRIEKLKETPELAGL